jgi:hypothetical protein
MSRKKLDSERKPYCIMLDVELKKILMDKQADRIRRTSRHCSFSQILHETIKKGLKE